MGTSGFVALGRRSLDGGLCFTTNSPATRTRSSPWGPRREQKSRSLAPRRFLIGLARAPRGNATPLLRLLFVVRHWTRGPARSSLSRISAERGFPGRAFAKGEDGSARCLRWARDFARNWHAETSPSEPDLSGTWVSQRGGDIGLAAAGECNFSWLRFTARQKPGGQDWDGGDTMPFLGGRVCSACLGPFDGLFARRSRRTALYYSREDQAAPISRRPTANIYIPLLPLQDNFALRLALSTLPSHTTPGKLFGVGPRTTAPLAAVPLGAARCGVR
ncbi:hypothetical protein HPB50_002267 [Hyalomma asiaticum]|uniref:Uncharacterized protein n=1 Tax=Hyalomma asiaticum TaxID=266040 RepID=A0ACB7TB86_HYAAI|nr:hypothetical protein HPB50_002267 [Hyalomma asiaticum]